MAINQINRLVWLVETISKAGYITFDELNQRWIAEERLSNGLELSKRTFHKWVDAVQDRFSLLIENENRGEYRYFISNQEELKLKCTPKVKQILRYTNEKKDDFSI